MNFQRRSINTGRLGESPLLPLFRRSLAEDIGQGDVTSNCTIPASTQGRAVLVARANGIFCGGPIAKILFRLVNPKLKVSIRKKDGQAIRRGEVSLTVEGSLRSILKAERVALNFLMHLSGISTLTAAYVKQVRGTSAKILDTRKTMPGLRLLEKYAVRCGGGKNHRMGLYDQVLVKTNHIRVLTKQGISWKSLFRRMRRRFGRKMKIEVEVTSLSELRRILPLSPDIVMLDNMSIPRMRQAVRFVRNWKGRKPLVEASGGITLANVRRIAQTGVDWISVGALTHSVPALDLALEVRSIQ